MLVVEFQVMLAAVRNNLLVFIHMILWLMLCYHQSLTGRRPFAFFPSQTGGEFKQMAVTTVRLVSHLPVSHF